MDQGLPPAIWRMPGESDPGAEENPRSTRHDEHGDRQAKPDSEVAMCPLLLFFHSSSNNSSWFGCRSSRYRRVVQVAWNSRLVDPTERSRMIPNNPSDVAEFAPKYCVFSYLQNRSPGLLCWCASEVRLSPWIVAINTPAQKGFSERGMLCRRRSTSNRLPSSSSCGLKTACRKHGR